MAYFVQERVTHTLPPIVNKVADCGFEIQRKCHQKSKTGVSVVQQKGLMSSKKFFSCQILLHVPKIQTELYENIFRCLNHYDAQHY